MTDHRLLDYLPHRPPMLLLNKIVSVGNDRAESEITVDSKSSFYVPGRGVPNWIGLEYMGQTAALIAGYQLQQGTVDPHVGFLLGTRKYRAVDAFFTDAMRLSVVCSEAAVVGNSLATFDGKISDADTGRELATTRLSVFRKFSEESK